MLDGTRAMSVFHGLGKGVDMEIEANQLHVDRQRSMKYSVVTNERPDARLLTHANRITDINSVMMHCAGPL